MNRGLIRTLLFLLPARLRRSVWPLWLSVGTTEESLARAAAKAEREVSSDIKRADTLRRALELLVGFTRSPVFVAFWIVLLFVGPADVAFPPLHGKDADSRDYLTRLWGVTTGALTITLPPPV